MIRFPTCAVIAMCISTPAWAQLSGSAAMPGGVLTPSEHNAFQGSFSDIEITEGRADPYKLGGALVFQQKEDAGLNLLQSAAAAGNADASMALGVAADAAGQSQAAYDWFSTSAQAGNAKALTWLGRSELYGLGTIKNFDAAVDSLLTSFEAGNSEAARDLAKASAYQWTTRSLQEPSTLWSRALGGGDVVTLLDYGRYLSAGGEPVKNTDAAVLFEPTLKNDPVMGSVASWDFARDQDLMPTGSVLTALMAAHDSGNAGATARLGEWFVNSDDPAEQKIGISYLDEAVGKGQSVAYTALGNHYISHADQAGSKEAALNMLLTGLRLGDPDAGTPLSRYYYREGDFGVAYDYAVLTSTAGTARGKMEAKQATINLCRDASAECKRIPVAFITSRRAKIHGDQVEFDGLPNDGFQPTYGFAEVMVPTEDAPADTDFDWWGAITNAFLSAFGAAPKPIDVFEQSAVQATIAGDWNDFSAALKHAMEQDKGRGGSGETLLFVHGVNTSFEGAVLAAARLKVKGNLPGVPVIYSWPAGDAVRTSDGAPPSLDYTSDVNTAARNCDAFQDFLVQFTKVIGSGNTTLIAHSHGSDMLVSGLTSCRGALPGDERVAPLLQHVIYAAPDIDRDEFVAIAPQIVKLAADVTLYASDADLAMFLSGDLINGNPRAGMGGARRTVVDGVDTIDLSNIAVGSGSNDGHGYLWTANAVLDDLNEIIRHDAQPTQRCLEKLTGAQGGAYWQFRSDCASQ
jgi:esterase/lipase superfamily enzyme/TPR repeat protein